MNKADASPDQARDNKIETLLQQASQLPAGERDVFLTRECGNDASLRQAVYERLLAESRGVKVKLEGRTGPVTSAVRQALAGSAHDRQVELLGKVVGDYRLVAIVGIGGAGTVYLGERADRAYSAQVAIKVVANTQLSHEIQRRFFAERQILANLNHPYIGRLLDAGETFFDEPFLVMEYVHGEPIDRFCDNQRLNVEERITLFLKICEAVQYAHRNLIVHRDLKPGNILVSKEGIPKLLDFGIAKLLDESAQAILHDGSAHTRVHDRLLTPEYASPEQIRGQPVTTTSDVYALGIVLYELLTGTRPYAVNALSQLELERSICIQDPLKPSQMIATLAKHATSSHPTLGDVNLIPTARKTSFKKLKQTLEGDLDAILMKALRKEPEKRYSSVEHLMDDLNRYLDHKPVEARQGNRWYYTQRFIKRHTLGVIAGTTALLALMAVAIILSIQAHQLKEQRDIAKQERDKATQENERAETVSNFMLDVFTAADPFQSQDKQVTAKELLDKAAAKIESTLNDQPEVKAQLLEAMGQAYIHQGATSTAINYLESSISIMKRNPGIGNKLAIALETLARAYRINGLYKQSTDTLSEAASMMRKDHRDKSPEYLQLLIDEGELALALGQPTLAETYYRQGLDLSKTIPATPELNTATLLRLMAEVESYQGKYSEAEPFARKALNLLSKKLTDKHPELLNAQLMTAQILNHEGKFNDAYPIVKKVLESQIAVFGEKSAKLMVTYETLMQIEAFNKIFVEAEVLARKILQIAETTSGSKSFDTGYAHRLLAEALYSRGKYSEAENQARLSLHILQQVVNPDHIFISISEYSLAKILTKEGHLKDAEILLRKNIDRLKRGKAPIGRIAVSESSLGVILMKLHNPTVAENFLLIAEKELSTENNGAPPEIIAMAHTRVKEFKRCEAEHRLNTCVLSE